MTFGFVLLTVGSVVLLSGIRNTTIPQTIAGEIGSRGPGEVGFMSRFGANSAVTTAVNFVAGNGGLVEFDGEMICEWIAKELQWARQNGWGGSVSSGHRSEQTQERVCSEVPAGTPCADPGKSNHQGKAWPTCAVDVSKPEELDRVLSRKRGRRLKWTGRSIGDDPHFSSGLNGV